MTSRERVLKILNHQIADRIPIQDNPLPETIQRWHKEGMPEIVSPEEFFDYDMRFFQADLSPRFPIHTIEKNKDFVIETTETGGKRKIFTDCSVNPEIIEYPIKEKNDWKEIKKRLTPDFLRVDWASGLGKNKKDFQEGNFLCFTCGYGYDYLRNYMRKEKLHSAAIEDPAWIKEILMTVTELIIIMVELMTKHGFRFDAGLVFDDIGINDSSPLSPDSYLKTHYEADRLLFGYFHSKGMKTILHSPGNVKELVPLLIESGLDCLQPIEVKSGMDVIELKQRYGDKLSLMGGIDVRPMSDQDPARIKKEIEIKFENVKKNGGYIYCSGSPINKEVSFEQYSHVIDLVKQYGTYPEYREEPKKVSPIPPQDTARPTHKKGLGLFHKKVKPTQGQQPATVSSTPEQPQPSPKPGEQKTEHLAASPVVQKLQSPAQELPIQPIKKPAPVQAPKPPVDKQLNRISLKPLSDIQNKPDVTQLQKISGTEKPETPVKPPAPYITPSPAPQPKPETPPAQQPEIKKSIQPPVPPPVSKPPEPQVQPETPVKPPAPDITPSPAPDAEPEEPDIKKAELPKPWELKLPKKESKWKL